MFLSFFLKVEAKGARGNRKPSLPGSSSSGTDVGTSEVHWHWLPCWPITYRKVASHGRAGLDKEPHASHRTERRQISSAFSKVLSIYCLV